MVWMGRGNQSAFPDVKIGYFNPDRVRNPGSGVDNIPSNISFFYLAFNPITTKSHQRTFLENIGLLVCGMASIVALLLNCTVMTDSPTAPHTSSTTLTVINNSSLPLGGCICRQARHHWETINWKFDDDFGRIQLRHHQYYARILTM